MANSIGCAIFASLARLIHDSAAAKPKDGQDTGELVDRYPRVDYETKSSTQFYGNAHHCRGHVDGLPVRSDDLSQSNRFWNLLIFNKEFHFIYRNF